jgi:hypothetical protein
MIQNAEFETTWKATVAALLMMLLRKALSELRNSRKMFRIAYLF